jgi:hypothetical protein
MPFVSRDCIGARGDTLFSMERQNTVPIDAVSPRVVLNRTVDGSSPWQLMFMRRCSGQ